MDQLTPTPAQVDECRGRFFRFTEAGFTGKGGRLVQSRELRPLRSISCPGCLDCAELVADIEVKVASRDSLLFNPELVSGDTATLIQVITSRNPANGEALTWFYEVIPANLG